MLTGNPSLDRFRCNTITNGNLQTTLAYDGLSRWSRITEYSNSTLIADRRFIYMGTALAEERDATGTNIIKRFFANGFWQQGTNYYYNTDHLGSILEVTTQNGTIIAKFQYDPYGHRTQIFGTLWVDFGYAGLFELPNGLKLAVWRIYDPSTGRWINRDPIREQGGWNLYAYCQGNPVNWVDPSGLIIIATGDQQYLDQVVAVITRLANDSGPFMANLLHTLSESATKYTISFTPGKDDNFNGRNAINWDPTAAGKQYISLLQYPREYWVMTPARLLGHELIHTYHFDTDPCAYNKNVGDKGELFKLFYWYWDNMEEYLTGQTENEHIHGVGGNLRLRHNGDYIKVAGPFSTQ